MKKNIFLTIAFMSLCATQQDILADEQDMTEQSAAVSDNQCEEAKKQHRYVRTQVFVNLLRKAQYSLDDAQKFIAYTLDWMQELSQSEDTEDQELYRQLYDIMSNIVQSMQVAEAQEGSAVPENQEDQVQ